MFKNVLKEKKKEKKKLLCPGTFQVWLSAFPLIDMNQLTMTD